MKLALFSKTGTRYSIVHDGMVSGRWKFIVRLNLWPVKLRWGWAL